MLLHNKRKIYYQNVVRAIADIVSRIMYGLLNIVYFAIRVTTQVYIQGNAINVWLNYIVERVNNNIKFIRMDGNGKQEHITVQELVLTSALAVLISSVLVLMKMIMKSIVHHVKKDMNYIMKNAFRSAVVPNVYYRMINLFALNVLHP